MLLNATVTILLGGCYIHLTKGLGVDCKCQALWYGRRARAADCRRILESSERGKLSVVSLDDKRLWNGYDHLFGQVHRAYLGEEQRHRVPTLHQLASECYEQSGLGVMRFATPFPLRILRERQA